MSRSLALNERCDHRLGFPDVLATLEENARQICLIGSSSPTSPTPRCARLWMMCKPVLNSFVPQPSTPSSDGCPGDVLMSGACQIEISKGSHTGPGAYQSTSVQPPVLVKPEGASGPQTEASNKTIQENYEQSLSANNISVSWCSALVGEKTKAEPGTESWRAHNRKVSMTQGFMGSVNQTAFPSPGSMTARVDALAQVCVPWSSTTWTMNWSWATVTVDAITKLGSAQFLDTEDKVFENIGWRLLSDVLFQVAEVRTVNKLDEADEVVGDPFFQYRYPSMKTCPPNYYLYGVNYLTREVDSERHLVGLKSLLCRAHGPRAAQGVSESKPIPSQIEVALAASSEHDGFRVELPPVNGDRFFTPYNLTQTIGNPSATGSAGEIGTVTCDATGEVVFATLLRRDSTTDAITYFDVLCVPAPAGGTP